MVNVMMDAVVFGRVWEGGGLPITKMEVVFACDGMMVVVMDLVAMKIDDVGVVDIGGGGCDG